MKGQQFELKQLSIKSILGMIEAGKFVIPEIQRPFVWKRVQVKDLVDSLFNGYPTGYIITWKNPDIKTKDGRTANGNEVLIDGQQRVTALMAALLGKEVLDQDFTHIRIKVAYNPLETDKTKRFAVQDASHLKDKRWIPDISVLFDPSFDAFSFTLQYCEDNPGTEPRGVNAAILGLKEIEHRQIGVIELNHDLDMDEVTEIFIRINSKGTVLSQSDFVMSKMASDERFGGNMLRKTVDYFCHLAVKPEFYASMLNDESFKASPYADRIKWLANDYEDIYDPDYNDMLRVSFMHRFRRGRLADLVSLLSGRDFATKEYKESIAEESYHTLADGINSFINQYNFSQFLMAIKGAGFIKRKLLNSKMTLDFAYALYLMLKEDKSIPNEQIKRLVQKWFVLTTLTSRYIGSPETVMSRDINSIEEKGFLRFFEEVEASDLSDNFWSVTLPQNLESSSSTTPAFNVFTAAQINRGADSLLISGTKVYDLIHTNGVADVHHIFPKEHLKKNGINKPIKYNQVANYIYLDTQVNKAIGDRPPCEYFSIVTAQCETKEIQLGNIQSAEDLAANLADNCLMPEIKDMDYIDYEAFLIERRKMMAKYIEEYYKKL